ncbi:hypothetical protein HNQ96_004339 [Aminobacter lissarensis]|uniref:Uncharacterized protein n=1 Tax=Aminobacter carboxidus TaxID=376165 RepID=A0A8E1WJE7_9HYPH|nr:hypothetical protein [Aminobacter lissarensis]MBB6468455.1 hypothetical protein [Aminobacter lissarensis]
MPKTYNRIAKQQKPKGHIFGPTGFFPLGDEAPEVEECLERNRPAHCLRRDGCVYMREDRDFSRMGLSYSEGYVHHVKPTGPVEQRDVTWIGYLQLLLNRNPRIRAVSEKQRMSRHGLTNDELAQRYWQGTLCSTPNLEHVTSEAEVVEVDSFLSPVKS